MGTNYSQFVGSSRVWFFHPGHNIYRGFQISKQLINLPKISLRSIRELLRHKASISNAESNPKNSNLEEPWHPHIENLEKNFH
jgi:hypothetical protein